MITLTSPIGILDTFYTWCDKYQNLQTKHERTKTTQHHYLNKNSTRKLSSRDKSKLLASSFKPISQARQLLVPCHLAQWSVCLFRAFVCSIACSLCPFYDGIFYYFDADRTWVAPVKGQLCLTYVSLLVNQEAN